MGFGYVLSISGCLISSTVLEETQQEQIQWNFIGFISVLLGFHIICFHKLIKLICRKNQRVWTHKFILKSLPFNKSHPIGTSSSHEVSQTLRHFRSEMSQTPCNVMCNSTLMSLPPWMSNSSLHPSHDALSKGPRHAPWCVCSKWRK